MKKISSSFIIIFSTFVSVITVVSYNNYVSNSKHYEENKLRNQEVVQYNKDYIKGKTIINGNQVKVVKKADKGILITKDYLETNELSQKKLSNDYKNEDKKNSGNPNVNSSNGNVKKINKSKDTYKDIYLLRRTDSLENYPYDNKENEQSVFKVSTGQIKENLTTSDKIKLLHVSMKLGKEDYKKVEEYLYAKDAEDGVLKALKLLREDLSKKEYEKVRKIAGRFIDMDAAERLY